MKLVKISKTCKLIVETYISITSRKNIYRAQIGSSAGIKSLIVKPKYIKYYLNYYNA